MTEFLKIDLEQYSQPALARLSELNCMDYEINAAETTITDAHFTMRSARIVRYGTETNPQTFQLNTEEMNILCDAWMDYNRRVTAYETEQEARKANAIKEAKALANSVHFDLEPLNIRTYEDGYYWVIKCDALGVERRANVERLPEIVQQVIDNRKERIEHAIHNKWHNSNGWKEMIASWERAMNAEQGEPPNEELDAMDQKDNQRIPELATLNDD